MKTLAILLMLTASATAQTAPAIKPIPLGPIGKYDKRPEGQQLNIVMMNDYGVIRFVCKSETAIACTSWNARECLILLGPKTHDDPRALAHEKLHCGGWPSDHPGARYD